MVGKKVGRYEVDKFGLVGKLSGVHIYGLAVLLVVLGGVLGWKMVISKKSNPPTKLAFPSGIPTIVPSPTVPKKVEELVATVEKKVELPEGEVPSVATVKEVSKLPESSFFLGAEVGDKVLIYREAKKAFLYRPSTGEVIREIEVEEVKNDSEVDSLSGSDVATVVASNSGEASGEGKLRVRY